MLCDHCIGMIQDAPSSPNELKDCQNSTFEDLLSAVDLGCYMCCNVFDSLQGEGAIEKIRNKLENPYYLLSRSWWCHIGQLDVYYATSIKHGYKRFRSHLYQLFPMSYEEDQFEVYNDQRGSSRLLHRLHTPIPSTTRAPEVLTLARSWYQQCRQNHKQCQLETPKWYPPRLLDVTSDSPELVLNEHIVRGEAFAALSHVWGLEPFLVLTQQSLTNFEKIGISPVDIPENFRNAMEVCRSLQIRYLWIDSLCIIQSGPGSQHDWESHVKIMRRIYASCDLCISTAAATSATDSCFKERDPTSIAPECIMVGGEPNLLVSMDHAVKGFREASIASRAWVRFRNTGVRVGLVLTVHQYSRYSKSACFHVVY
jgi:hypothetical protein